MSRSVHSNRSRRLLASRGYLDWEEIAQKRLIKELVRIERNPEPVVTPPPVTAAAIPVTIRDAHEILFVPVSLEDVRHVLDALPAGTLNGLGGITVRAGTRYVNQQSEEGTPDPFLRRKSVEFAPGIWLPAILGTYHRRTMKVNLFAYVKSPEATVTREQAIELRLRMLRTLLHEVAHHQDRTQRVARGRWRMDETERDERYADIMTRRWLLDVVVPYLAAEVRGS